MNQSIFNKQKRAIFEQMLEHGIVMLHLDPRPDGVVVPAEYKERPILQLNLAYGFNLPWFDITDECVFAALSFQGMESNVRIPWEAVYYMSWPDMEHAGAIWPTSFEGNVVLLYPSTSAASVEEGKEEAPVHKLRLIADEEPEP